MAIQRLIQSGVVDPERVGITGFSHGEEIVGYAITHSHLFHAAIGAAGYDPCFFYIGGTVWQKMFERWGLGGWPEGAAKERWEEISMSLRADRITIPLLENASDSEYVSYLPRVIALRELGKPVELRIYPDELHVRNQPRHKYEIYMRNVD
jgi:dipeptidyl aminopeptidase/acylaminoacyl peptidase